MHRAGVGLLARLSKSAFRRGALVGLAAGGWLLCAGCALRPGAGSAVARLDVPLLAGELSVDGRLTEACYRAPAALTSFVIAGNCPAQPQPTRAWLFWDPDRLIIAFDVSDAQIVAAPETGHEHDVDDQDRVEVFLWSGRANATYYCIEVGARGAVHDYSARFYRRFDDRWTPAGMKAAVAPTPTGYQVEIQLPRAAIEAAGFKLQAGDQLRCGLFRADFRPDQPGAPTWICWVDARTRQPDFHVAGAFGEIILLGSADHVAVPAASGAPGADAIQPLASPALLAPTPANPEQSSVASISANRSGVPGVPVATNAPPGRRIKLTDGQLFIPAGFQSSPESPDLTLHLHGFDAAERGFVAAKLPGVFVSVSLPGLSGVYVNKFREAEVFGRILRETAAQLAAPGQTNPPPFRHVTVSSFSAGFGGVRELLKDPAAFARIDALVMADSIYAGFTGEAAQRRVDPANMEGFLRFAREAAAGRKRMIITHTQLHTPSYASTVETADYLIAQLGGQREQLAQDWPGGLRLLSRFQQGRLGIHGFAGDTGADHMKHLRNLGVFLARVWE